jgi:hypothetical protein
MAETTPTYSQIKEQIEAGNMREAYRVFEQLPIKDQIAISVAPGIGDALAAYEVGEFGRRGVTAFREGKKLGAAGNIALAGLAGISLIPLFRFLRGARGAAKTAPKAVDSPKKTEKPPVVEEPLSLPAPKDDLPEVKEFVPKPLAEMNYRIGPQQPELASKARKYLNNMQVAGTRKINTKLDDLTPDEWVDELGKLGPEIFGELRLLNVITESGDIHPKLLKSAGEGRTITKKGLDNYLAREQSNAINARTVQPGQSGYIDDTLANSLLSNKEQNIYFLRAPKSVKPRGRNDIHMSGFNQDGLRGNRHYTFDGYARNFRPALRNPATNEVGEGIPNPSSGVQKKIQDMIDDLKLEPTDKFSSTVRIQSDYMQHELRGFQIAKKEKFDTLTNVLSMDGARNLQNLSEVVDDNPKVYKRLLTPKAHKALQTKDVDTLKEILGPDDYQRLFGTDRAELIKATDKYLKRAQLSATSPDVRNLPENFRTQDMVENIAETMRRVFLEEVQGAPRFVRSKGKILKGFYSSTSDKVEYKAITKKEFFSNVYMRLEGLEGNFLINLTENAGEMARKDLDKLFDKILKEVATPFEQEQILLKFTNKTGKYFSAFEDPVAQKIINKRLIDANKSVEKIRELRAAGKPAANEVEELAKSIEGFNIEFGITPREFERATGKPFADAIGLSQDEIFNMVDASGQRVYKGIDYDDRRGLLQAFFDDMGDPSKMFMETGDGDTVVKNVVDLVDEDLLPFIDPYVVTQRSGYKNTKGEMPILSNYGKLPIRRGIAKAYDEGADGFHAGPAQLIDEARGNPDKITLDQYAANEKEIAKVINELLPNPKDRTGVLHKIEGTDTIYDGTYIKFTDKLKKALAEKGVDAFAKGGAVESDNIKSTYKLPNDIKNNVFKIINTDIQDLHEDVVRPKFKKLGIDRSQIQLKKDYDFYGNDSYNAYYVLADAYLDGKITQDDIYEYFRKIEPENFLNKDGNRYKNMQNMFNASDQDSYFYDIIRSVKTQKKAEKQYRALIKRLKKDHNVTVQDYEYGNPQNKRQRITDYLFKFSGEKARANVSMARPFIDPAGEAIINMPVDYDFKEKLEILNEELFHVGQYRDEAITGKPIDRLRNVKYLMPPGIRGLIPSDPNIEFLNKARNEALRDFIGYKLGTHSHQYGRYYDPEAIEGIHRDYEQSEEYLKQFGLSSTDPESFTYRDPKSEYFFQNPRKQYAGFAEGGPTSKAELEDKIEEIQKLLEFRAYDNLFKGGTLDDLYQDYDASKDVVKDIESQVSKNLAESLKLPYQDVIADILQADDPSKEFAKRKDAFQLKKIDEAISALNLPVDVNVGLDSAQITKEIPLPGNVDLAFGAFKDPNKDVKTAAGLGFTESGKFGDLDIFGATGDYMPPGLYADYTLGDIKKGPLQIDVTKKPGSDIETKAQLKIGDKTSPFQFDVMKQPGHDYALSGRYTLDKDIFPADSLYGETYRVPTQLEISKQPNRDLYGKYEVDILGGEGQSLAPIKDFNVAPRTRLGGRGSIGLSFMVDTLKNAGLRLQYMYENPETGGFFNLTYDPKATQTINMPDNIDSQLRELTYGQPLSIEFGRQF